MSGPNQQAIYAINWYPNKFPENEETVMVEYTEINQMGVWVKLLQYGSQVGMIPIGYLTTRKSRNVPKNMKVGTQQIAIVQKVDEEKGNMDLTRQGLKDDDSKAAEKKFNDYKSLMNLLNYVAYETHHPLQQLVETVAYPLHKKHGNAYLALQNSYKDSEILENLDCPEDALDLIQKQLSRTSVPQEERFHAEFEAEVLTAEGVNALREVLTSGYDVAPDEKMDICVIAPPLYSVTLTKIGSDSALDIVRSVLKKIEDGLQNVGGRYTIKMEPKSLTQKELQEMDEVLTELEAGSQLVNMDDEEM